MIHDPHRHTLTAVISVDPPAFVLLDDADRAGRVAGGDGCSPGWPNPGTCAAVQVLEATVPDPGDRPAPNGGPQPPRRLTAGGPTSQYDDAARPGRPRQLHPSHHHQPLARHASRRPGRQGRRRPGMTGAAEVLRAGHGQPSPKPSA